MPSFAHLVRFECEEDGKAYFSDLGSDANGPPAPGTKLLAFASFDELVNQTEGKKITVRRVGDLLHFFPDSFSDIICSDESLQLLAPLLRDGIPIYCVGLNYRSHAKEADVTPIGSKNM